MVHLFGLVIFYLNIDSWRENSKTPKIMGTTFGLFRDSVDMVCRLRIDIEFRNKVNFQFRLFCKFTLQKTTNSQRG